MKKKYKLKILTIFENDLNQIVDYISFNLKVDFRLNKST